MANYNQVSYGSQGADVKKLQELLNSKGAKLSVDGIFGNQTQQAVKNYQKANGLAVDGIVGNNTWGALTKAQTTTAPTTPAPTETKTPTFEYEAYKPSDTVAQAEVLLKQHLANKPGAYQSEWQTQLNDTLNKILNREKFSYDLNGDALYQQYKDQYTTQGKMAMMDTMGQAQAMTGGYGNSYAQSVGQQAYQGYLQQLNDKVPELYQLALNQYNAEGDDLYNQASLMAGMEEQEYGRYRDKMSDYYTELDRLTNDARYQAETDYGKWMDKTNLDYGIHRDAVEDKQWDDSFRYQKDRDKIEDDLVKVANSQKATQQEFENALAMFKTLGYATPEIAKVLGVEPGYSLVDKDPDEPGDGDGTGGFQEVDTEATTKFKGTMPTSREYSRYSDYKEKYGSYKNYLEAQIDEWLSAGKLTDDEAATLMAYYNLV